MSASPTRHRILFQSNPTWLRTGLSENTRTLLAYLFKSGRYDIAQLCTMATMQNDPKLHLMPWRCYGSVPADQEVINRINADPIYGRDASYGALGIDAAVADWKPTIWIGSDDLWSFPLAAYCDKPWYKRLHGIHHTTVDSVPILDQAFEQARRSKHYLTWAPFAAREMQRVGGDSMAHVSSIYGAMDTAAFEPIDPKVRADLRRQFGLAPDTFVFLFVFRNQLRKAAGQVLEAYARFRADNPGIKAALHLHTAFHEKAQGWDIPKLATYHGVNPQELLCTYVCKRCGAWSIAPFAGEEQRCPMCGDDKGLNTASITHGVPTQQMKLVYGVADACISAFSSGGQEYHSVQSLLCGKPLACTSYSCGEDFCTPETKPFVHPIRWGSYNEPGTSFIKAANDVGSICGFMTRMARSSQRDREEAGEMGRAWTKQTFGIEAIGAQWEALFAKLALNPEAGLLEISGEGRPAAKNPGYVPSANPDGAAWIKELYRGMLVMDVPDGDSGLSHWIDKLKAGIPREQIVAYFRSVAEQENAKHGYSTVGAPQTTDFATLLDNTGRARGLIIVKESIGDICMATALFESFHRQHPETDLYVAVDPRYAEVLAGNEDVHKVLPYIPQMESELLMIGQANGPRYFSAYYHMCIQSQRLLSYVSQPEPAFDLRLPPPDYTAALIPTIPLDTLALPVRP